MKDLPDKALDQIAAYFQALSEPTRLKILNLLREQERSVGELAQLSGYSAANVSRHLSYLAQHGIVQRESVRQHRPPIRTSLQRPRRVRAHLKATPRPHLVTVWSFFSAAWLQHGSKVLPKAARAQSQIAIMAAHKAPTIAEGPRRLA